MNTKTEKFLDIVDKHKRLIYKIVNAYCKDKNNHEDLVQEIILQLWSSYGNYNERFKLTTWIYRISLNTAISFYRKSIKQKQSTSELTPLLENTLEGKKSYKENPNIALLNKFITELKEIDRAIIILHLEELSHKEIANIIGITPTNVGTKLARIKKIIHNKFQSNKNYNKNGE